MIGNKKQIKEIKELLQTIAKDNREKYGHILDDTDCGSTEIFLGYYKNDFDEDRKYRMRFDIIYGDFIDVEGDSSRLMWGEYFSLSDSFEEDMRKKIMVFIEKDKKALKEGEQTIHRLKNCISSD